MAARPKVCFVVEGTGVDGTPRFVLDVIRFADRARIRHDVVCLHRAGALAIPIQHEDVPVHALDLPDPPGIARGWWTFSGTLALLQVFRRLKPDLVHTVDLRAGVMGRIAARLAGVPRVVATTRRAERGQAFASLLARATAYMLDVHVAAGPALAAEAGRRFGVHPARVRIVPPGVDAGALAGSAPATLPGGRPVIGSLGRLVPEKGFDTLLEAVPILRRYHPDLRVFVAGTGPEGLPLVRRSQRLGIDAAVTFSGDREDPGAVLAALDVFVLPSRIEGAPRALLEALASGRPVVATRVPGVTDLVEDGVHALLVPPERPALLADAIDRLLADPDLARRLAAAGRSLVLSRHRAADMAAAIQSLHERLLGMSAAAPAAMEV